MTTTTKQGSKSDKIDMTAMEAELRPLSTEKLKALFIECYGKAAEFIARAAMCVKLMEERGENLKGFPMIGVFRRVACGQILAQTVWTFIESPGRAIIERCTVPDQEKLVENPIVPVVELTADGKSYTPRQVDLRTAHVSVVKQAIGPDGPRTEEEQIVYLKTQKPRPAEAAAKDEDEDVREALTHRLEVKLTDSEWKELRIEAANANTSERAMGRRFIIQALSKRRKS